MYFSQLQRLVQGKGWRAAQLARAVGVSRAAVTKWWRQGVKTGWVNVETSTLRRLAEGLGVTPDRLLLPPDPLDAVATELLWDALYPDMNAFLRALHARQLPAMARLVQVLGLRDATHVLGRCVVTRFPRYKHFLKPIRRQHLEQLWPLYRSTK